MKTKKNGIRNNIQLFKCLECGYQFREGKETSDDELWHAYQDRKQTMSDIASSLNVSRSTIKRRFSSIKAKWKQPDLTGGGYVHLDATYFDRDSGLILGLEEESGKALYLAFIKHEKAVDYRLAIESIERRGYEVKGIIVDGMRCLFTLFAGYNIQMCHFHMMQIVSRYLTLKPTLRAAKALQRIMYTLTTSTRKDFEDKFVQWKQEWSKTINHRHVSKVTGKSHYTHRRLRAAMNSISFYMPYLFTYQRDDCKGMPNTNNKIEGTFTDLKTNLNVHHGMSKANRKRFASRFFEA